MIFRSVKVKGKSFLFAGILFFASCEEDSFVKLSALDTPKKAPAEYDWLSEHQELYQSLPAYKNSQPVRATSERPFLYIVKMGRYSASDDSLFSIVSKGLCACFQIPVKVLAPLPDTVMRTLQSRENGQWDANFIIQQVLPRRIPKNAVALIALCSRDLYPGNDWNYVFGLASLKNRTGVWSFYRMGNPDCESGKLMLTAKRTLHVALHETGHMIGIRHCVSYECLMNGSNSIDELDRQVGWFCHDCLKKLCWNRKLLPERHIQAMHNFYSNYLPDTTLLNYYSQAIELLNESSTYQ